MAQAATELVETQTRRRMQRFTVCLAEWEGQGAPTRPKTALGFCLSDKMLDEKIAAARSYIELRSEVDRALALKGPGYFREEYLLPASGWSIERSDYKPSYETYGELRVAEGKYARVLRYREHVRPIFEALKEHVGHRDTIDLLSHSST
jgi:hypothetical protein